MLLTTFSLPFTSKTISARTPPPAIQHCGGPTSRGWILALVKPSSRVCRPPRAGGGTVSTTLISAVIALPPLSRCVCFTARHTCSTKSFIHSCVLPPDRKINSRRAASFSISLSSVSPASSKAPDAQEGPRKYRRICFMNRKR